MSKYCVNVYDRDSKQKIISFITDTNDLLYTISKFKDVGEIKAYILDRDNLEREEEK